MTTAHDLPALAAGTAPEDTTAGAGSLPGIVPQGKARTVPGKVTKEDIVAPEREQVGPSRRGPARRAGRGTPRSQRPHGPDGAGETAGTAGGRSGGAGRQRGAGSRTGATGREALAEVMTERELEEQVRDACKKLGLLRFHVRVMKGTTAGLPDDILIGPGGILWRELKNQTYKPTAAQVKTGEALTGIGQDFDIWRPVDWFSGRVQRELAAISKLERRAA